MAKIEIPQGRQKARGFTPAIDLNYASNGRNANSPGRPASLQDVRDFVREQKKVFGQRIATTANVEISISLIFPSAATFLLGFAFAPDVAGTTGVPDGTMNVLVNNEQFVSGVPCAFLNVANRTFEYFAFPRPLAGVDKVLLQITATRSETVNFAIYYI